MGIISGNGYVFSDIWSYFVENRELWGTILSGASALASAITAILVYRFNQKQSQQKFKTDLYNTIIHLAGFINHVQVLYEYHDSDLDHMVPVVENIMNYGNNHNITLNVDQGFYYNDYFDQDVICKIGCFMSAYFSWMTFQPVKPEEFFLEVDMMLDTQKKVIDALKVIQEKYQDDKKVINIINAICKSNNRVSDNTIDIINNRCIKMRNQLKHIRMNLAYIFYLDFSRSRSEEQEESDDMDLQWEKICKKIVAACFSEILADNVGQGDYADVSSFLFCKEIVEDYNIVRIESTDGNQISWNKICSYLCNLISNPD